MNRTMPPHSRRHRPLTEDEKALWHAVAKSATPLKRGKRGAKEARPEGDDIAGDGSQSPAGVPAAKSANARQRPRRPLDALPQPPALAPISRREKSRLSRGRQDIDARIDLHGMTQTRAHRALLAFLQRAHADGAAFVLVITGKGRSTDAGREQGVLRRQVPLWLALPEFRAIVVGFEQAHIGHGGEGALYVRVRRSRG
jgi:DNA-nicking Smr family endonuclease